MIKYYGGKIWLGKQIEKYLPNDKMNGFVDLFVGGGSITDVMSNHYKNIIINDLDKNLINFYNVAKNDYGTLLELTFKLRDNITFEDVKRFRYELDNEDDEYLRAFKYYTCVYCGYGGKPYASPTKDKFNQYKNRDIGKDLRLCRDTLFFAEILSKDYSELKYNGFLYYCDPPYYKVGDNTYYGLKGKSHKDFDHIRFKEYIDNISKTNKVIISYEDSKEIRELYRDFNFVELNKKTVNYNPNNKNNETLQTNELLIMNY